MRAFPVLLVSFSIALAGCDDSGVDTASSTPPELLPCPNATEVAAVQAIGPEGGTLEIGPHVLQIDAGAVADTVSFAGTILADPLLKVRIQADGAESFDFAGTTSATLTLSYATCSPAPSAPSTLLIYKIDPITNDTIRNLGGTVDTGAQTVTAPLDSLSTYALGSPT